MGINPSKGKAPFFLPFMALYEFHTKNITLPHQRCDVLAFIGEHFDVLEGVLDPESSMGITVARKRIS